MSNASLLDKVKNAALQATASAMEKMLLKEMEKRADLEPLELWRTM